MSRATPLRVLVTGAFGQLGTELRRSAPDTTELFAAGRAHLDITDRSKVLDAVAAFRPGLIVNAAAYTAVDRAERESELAYTVNRDAAAHLAEAAQVHKARLVHVSTDYVFDGSQSRPYLPSDRPNPLNVYGASKLAGEQAVIDRTDGAAVVVRAAWVYASSGSNFVATMHRLLRERREVRVVCDQIGTPTHAAGLATALWRLALQTEARGVYHWTDAGVASWYDFAAEIRRSEARRCPGEALAQVLPITSAEYPTAARRPACVVLDKQSLWALVGPARHWVDEFEQFLDARDLAPNAQAGH